MVVWGRVRKKVALADEHGRVSDAELDRSMSCAAAGLQRDGRVQGPTVTVVCPCSLAQAVVFLGAVGFYVARSDAPAAELLADITAQLGKTQRLSALHRVAELPRSAIGKVLKRELRDRVAAGEFA